ncbi:MAG TPA: hypothetical protein VHO06_18715, partial [Polyangia bacterium]|nr:hypothetical protein [Polyangia bacterium]
DAVVPINGPADRVAEYDTEPLITQEALLAAVNRAAGADWVLLIAGTDAVVDAGQADWVGPALSRLRADRDLIAIGIPNGGARGARGGARGAPLGVRGATWDSRLRLWRSRGVAGLVFVADRARLREALQAAAAAPGRAGPLAAILEGALGAARSAKSFGTLAAKEAWTRRSSTSVPALQRDAAAERPSV